jgi:hypothetical protein
MVDQLNAVNDLLLRFSLAESEGAEVVERLQDEYSDAYDALYEMIDRDCVWLQVAEAAYFYIPAAATSKSSSYYWLLLAIIATQ